MEKLAKKWKVVFLLVTIMFIHASFVNFASEDANECGPRVKLMNFTARNSQPEQQVFFLETSGRRNLAGRECCSIESAALNSGLVAKVIMRSPFLDLSANECLCKLYTDEPNVEFYTIDFEELLRDTPVEGLQSRAGLAGSQGSVAHLSTVGRLALAYKHGGFYLDLDTIALKSLVHLNNLFVLEKNVQHTMYDRYGLSFLCFLAVISGGVHK